MKGCSSGRKAETRTTSHVPQSGETKGRRSRRNRASATDMIRETRAKRNMSDRPGVVKPEVRPS